VSRTVRSGRPLLGGLSPVWPAPGTNGGLDVVTAAAAAVVEADPGLDGAELLDGGGVEDDGGVDDDGGGVDGGVEDDGGGGVEEGGGGGVDDGGGVAHGPWLRLNWPLQPS